jgi:hypothetical protein
MGATGPMGPVGPTGATGAKGDTGPGFYPNFADFYGQMSSSGVNDNPDAINPGDAISFPSPAINPFGIQRYGTSTTEFVLPPDSIFEIIFQVTIQNTGELVVVLNGNELIETVVGKSGGGVVVGTCIIFTPSSINSVISINNPSTANAGGIKVDEPSGALTQPLSCHLIIKKLQ